MAELLIFIAEDMECSSGSRTQACLQTISRPSPPWSELECVPEALDSQAPLAVQPVCPVTLDELLAVD